MYSYQSQTLSTLCHAPAAVVKDFSETLLPQLGEVRVIKNCTGLVMQPYRDTAQGALFHLGEILLAEAHVRLEAHAIEGYAACLGRDLEQALAIALLDACLSAQLHTDTILSFVREQREAQEAAETQRMRRVEATRVEMETF